jgi:dihydropteroate synthase
VAASVLGGAHIVRVHDVKEMVQVVRVCDAILAADGGRARGAEQAS